MERDVAMRSEPQLLDEVSAARRRLAANLDGLVAENHPKAVVHRVREEATSFAREQVAQAKEQVKDEYGWRVDRFVLVGGAVLGAVTFLLVVRALSKRAS